MLIFKVFYGFSSNNFNKILVNDNVSYFAINNQKYIIIAFY